ncbi:DUF222 domain-containing protein [Haloactinopolyspora sp.]|uniref:HNH endonuclease n=1 Tax=Haloactinopolyspora sp. TaxID=1966353 RepID=UPI00263210B3|nr:DUF222 domain-containing protein [Haloactinopolyspora sp.]
MDSPPPTPEWADYPPGVELAAVLEEVDVAGLDDDSPVVDLIVAVERQVAHLRAVQMRAIVELSQRENYRFCGGCDDDAEMHSTRHWHDPIRAVGSELSAALSCTPAQADARAALAVELTDDLPATLDALDAGRIDERRAELIASRTRVLEGDKQRLVEQRILPDAGQLTTRQLARRLDREVIAADPAAAERRRQEGQARRRVEMPRSYPGGDGMGEMVLVGPMEDLAALYAAIDAAARSARSAGDQRTLNQLRFDIITGLGWNALRSGFLGGCRPTPGTSGPDEGDCDSDDAIDADDAPDGDSGQDAPEAPRAGSGCCRGDGYRTDSRQHGRAATVNVTMALSTLLGRDDRPAELEGYGPITAQAGRMITTKGAGLRRMLTDPVDGQLLEYGRTRYTPPQALIDFIIARDRTCRFPTNDTPARASDIDHRIPYQRGGTTGAGNNQALARRFHLDKTLHGWELYQPAPGVYVWVSPAGRIYRTLPEVIGFIEESPPGPEPPPDPEPLPDPLEAPPF